MRNYLSMLRRRNVRLWAGAALCTGGLFLASGPFAQAGLPWATREVKTPAASGVGRMMTIAAQFEKQKNYNKAAAIYRQVLQQNQGHLEAQKRLDFVLAQMGESSGSATMIATNQAHHIPTTLPPQIPVQEITRPQKAVVERLLVKTPMPPATHGRLPQRQESPAPTEIAEEEPSTTVEPLPVEVPASEYPPRLTANEEREDHSEPKLLSVLGNPNPYTVFNAAPARKPMWRPAAPLDDERPALKIDPRLSSPFRAMLTEVNSTREQAIEEESEEEESGVIRLSEASEESEGKERKVITTHTQNEAGSEDEENTVAEPEAAHRPAWKARPSEEGIVVESARSSTKIVAVTPLTTEVESAPPRLMTISEEVPAAERTLVSSRLQENENSEFRTGLQALCPRATQEIRRLIRSMETPNVRLRKGSMLRLCEAGPAAEAALPAIRELLLDPVDSVRVLAARSLWKINHETTGLQILQDVARRGNLEDTCLAAYTLGEMGDSAREAIPLLEDLCHKRQGLVRLHAAEAVWKIRGQDERSLTIMMNALNSTDISERWVAAYVLSATGSKRLSLINALNMALDDREPVVQSSAAFGLGCLGKDASVATPRLVSLFESTTLDQHLRVTAYHALSNIEPLTAQKFTKMELTPQAPPQTVGQIRR